MSESSQKKALERAAAVLGMRPYSCAGLYSRLLEKGIAQDDAQYAVSRLCEMGMLDDTEYARLLCRSGRNKGWGAGRVRRELRAKGVPDECAETALCEFEPDAERLARFVKSRLGSGPADRAALRRVSDALFRRGFSWDEINEALRGALEEMGEDL